MCDSHPTGFKEETRRARKKHICDECILPILPGTMYVYTSGIWDRRPESFAQHVECRALLLDNPDDDGCWVYGTLPTIASQVPEVGEAFRRIQALYAPMEGPEELSP